jgi:general secretion pathway protein J
VKLKVRTQLPYIVDAHGFTLLELLIAMTLLVLIVTITMGALRLASRSVETGERRMAEQERFRTVTTLIDAQVQSHLPLTREEGGSKVYYFRGDSKTLRLATSCSLWGGKRGCVVVDYRIESGKGGKQTLHAQEQIQGCEEKREVMLFPDATAISFEYYHTEPDEAIGRWSEQWSDATLIPEKIRLRIAFDAKESFFLFPVRAQGLKLSVPMTPAQVSPMSKPMM